MLSLQSFLREGRVVGRCWANQNLNDLKDLYMSEVPLQARFGQKGPTSVCLHGYLAHKKTPTP